MEARSILLLLARLLVAQLFLVGSLQKWLSPGDVEGLLTARGWPAWLVWPALAANLLGGAALVIGWRLREVSVALVAYCAVTSLFHFVLDDPWQMSIFVKNWAIAGGCLALAAAGAGRYAIRSSPGPGRPPPLR